MLGTDHNVITYRSRISSRIARLTELNYDITMTTVVRGFYLNSWNKVQSLYIIILYRSPGCFSNSLSLVTNAKPSLTVTVTDITFYRVLS